MINRQRKRKHIFTVLLVGTAIISLAALVASLYFRHFQGNFSERQDVWGQFGDYLGGVLNPIFGFITILVLVWTLLEQRTELREQRAYLKRQVFEATFFQLLHRFDEVIDDLEYLQFSAHPPNNLYKVQPIKFGPTQVFIRVFQGREALPLFFFAFQDELKTMQDEGIFSPDIPDLQRYATANEAVFQHNETSLGPYFRTLYHIFKFVDTSALPFEDRAGYANIARSRLSSFELSLVFYNALWGEGQEGFKPLIEKYGVLKHLKDRHLIKPADLADRTMLGATAFLSFKRRLEIWNGDEPLISYD